MYSSYLLTSCWPSAIFASVQKRACLARSKPRKLTARATTVRRTTMKKISPRKLNLAAQLLATDMAVKDIVDCAGVTERTIRRWSKRPEIATLVAEEAELARSVARQ